MTAAEKSRSLATTRRIVAAQAKAVSRNKMVAQSDLESRLILSLRAARLPMPVAEFKFHPTRRWRADLAYPDKMILIECEGGSWSGGRHVTGQGFEDDCQKYAEAAVLGYRVLRFTGKQIRAGYATDCIRRMVGK